jgi:hypothetical protein
MPLISTLARTDESLRIMAQNRKVQKKCNLSRCLRPRKFELAHAILASTAGSFYQVLVGTKCRLYYVIDDESLVKTRTDTCLSETSGVPSYSVIMAWQQLRLREQRLAISVCLII